MADPMSTSYWVRKSGHSLLVTTAFILAPTQGQKDSPSHRHMKGALVRINDVLLFLFLPPHVQTVLDLKGGRQTSELI